MLLKKKNKNLQKL